MNRNLKFLVLFLMMAQFVFSQDVTRVALSADMIISAPVEGSQVIGVIDEQDGIVGSPSGNPISAWNGEDGEFPVHAVFDLKDSKNLSKLWLYDVAGKGELVVSVGTPGAWEEVTTYESNKDSKWAMIPMDVTTRYIRLSKLDKGANVSEIAVYEYTKAAYEAMLVENARIIKEKAEKAELMRISKEEMMKNPVVDLGEPYGKVYLVDEVDCSKSDTSHMFAEYPVDGSKVEKILGKDCRVMPLVPRSGSYFTYRLGKGKKLQAGARYLLVVSFPEDKSRMTIVINTGAESVRGIQTGLSVGDSFHPKYVNNLNESLDIPLTGAWENWTQLFQLHDRFVEYNKLPRGAKPRPLLPKDGFNVTIAQFSKENLPISAGAAVAKISLYAVPEPDYLTLDINYPPNNLPKRRLFWREEMADGVLGGNDRFKTPKAGKENIGWGVGNFLDWYRFKAERMKFLGMNTYTKDLLEFGANQGWDSTPYGGNDWVFQGSVKHYWKNIVKLMNEYEFDVLPYYEYSGSKGYNGLGRQRRCEPLNREDGFYTHIKWMESATADITDPDTYIDFKKMLDLTVINEKNNANFAGIWLRPRGQLPVSFSEKTIQRFIDEANGGKKIKKSDIQKDKELYNRYIAWWELKRKQFLVSMQQYLVDNGLKDPIMLFTGNSSEPGYGFRNWRPTMVTDNPDVWGPVLKQPEHIGDKGKTVIYSEEDVVNDDLYLEALLSAGKNWGGYEVNHSHPADDPINYKDVDGVMLTQGFNRRYTVLAEKTFDAYRSPAGLAIVRYFSLNENMMFDAKDKALLGYFCVDVERAGPYCMMSEAISMVNGNPTIIGYLSGTDYHRGFAKYVRHFNAAYLSLPAMASEPLDGACADKDVAVKQIKTPGDGTYIYAVNLSYDDKSVEIKLPSGKKYFDAMTGKAIVNVDGVVTVDMYPYQMRTFLVK
jgi:hypothetical protein